MEKKTSKTASKGGKPELRQMNLRVRDDVRESFKRFCAEHKMTQSEALRSLLAHSDSRESSAMVQSLEDDLTDQKQKTAQLQQEINALRANHSYAVQRSSAWNFIFRSVMQHLLDRTSEKELRHPVIKIDNIKYWTARKEYRTHPYPKEFGCCVFRLESMMYGKGRTPPLFLTGETEDGEPMKFRLYPKKDHIGIDPRTKEYRYVGSEWLMGYIIAKDGAADLYVSIPLDALWKDDIQELTFEKQTAALDMIIATAKKKQ